jgi:transposase
MPRYNQPRKTWRYTNEFKAKAVELTYLEDIKIKDVAETLGIHPFMLSRWRKEYREGKIVADKKRKVTGFGEEKKEMNHVKKLESENARLRQENDLLKKWQRYLAEQHQSALDSSRNTDES